MTYDTRGERVQREGSPGLFASVLRAAGSGRGDSKILPDFRRRPQAWERLSSEDAALLDFLRHGGKTSELPPEETICKTLALISEKGRLGRLFQVAESEAPRVRAMLGAIAEEPGKNTAAGARLRASLNPLSRFDFGLLTGLSHARSWQAGERAE